MMKFSRNIITGYSRDEVLGRNCKFLQCEDMSEEEQVSAMGNALSSAQPVRVALTNMRKDGSEFLNIVSMHPVFDNLDGEFSFVVSVQFKMKEDDRGDNIRLEPSLKRKKLITKIQKALPIVDQLLTIMTTVLA
jgi:PAS domain-containing protein